MALISTLIQGSQLLNTFSTITFVQVLFAKGFSIGATLKASYLPSTNSIRFWLEETVGDTFTMVNDEAIFAVPTGALDTSINAYALPVYSKSGAVLILKVDPTQASYASFIQEATPLASRIVATITETLSFNHLTSVAASNLNGSINRENGLSVFDNSYVNVFNKRPTLPVNITGVIPFITSGFETGKMWMKQSTDASGNIYLAVASNSNTGADNDFGTPVLVAQNTGTVASPVYAYPSNPYTSLPVTKYQFSGSSYGYTTTTTSPFPYLIATSADGKSSFVFTVILALLNKTYSGKGTVSFDDGAHYLRLFKSGESPNLGLGGAISSQVLLSSMMVLPTTSITGIRVISVGGITSSDLKIKQRSATTSQQVVLQGTYPVLDINNRVYLSLSEGNTLNNPGLYGAEVDITESGTYVIHSQLGGTITVVTNRLLYNPYYNGYEQLQFNTVDSDLLQSVTPGQVINGLTDYECFYIKNTHPTLPFAKITIWSDLNCNNLVGAQTNSQYVQYGVYDPGTRKGDGTDNITIPNNTTAPTGVTFGLVNAESSGLVINNLLPGQCVPIWVERTVNASQTVTQQDVVNYLRFKVMY